MSMALRVGFVLPDLRLGGAERLVVDMVEAWRRCGEAIEPRFYAFRDGPVRDALRELGCTVTLAPSCRRVNPTLVPWLARRLRVDRIRLVHAHLPRAGVYARLAGQIVGVPVVYTEHSLWSLHHPLSALLNRLTYGLNAHVVAVSAAVRKSIGPGLLPPERLTVVHNGVPPRNMATPGSRSRVREALGLAPTALVLGSVANLHARKGLEHLLTAIVRLVEEFPCLHWLAVGRDDGEGGRLDRMAHDAGIARRLHRVGFRFDARDLLPALDVFVLPSLFEGLPVALIEAMEAGLPSVVTRVGGSPELVVHGETGLIVDPGDPEQLASALRLLLADADRREQMGRRARQRAHAEFSIEAVASRYSTLYRSIIGHTAAPGGAWSKIDDRAGEPAATSI